MLLEKNIMWACVGLSGAIIAPVVTDALKGTDREATWVPLVSAVLGAAGVYGGALYSATYASPRWRAAGLVLWAAIALALSGAITAGALGTAPTPLWRVLGVAAAFLPSVAYICTLVMARREMD
ncbi:hypothetical protein KQI84_17250 [bacterium]|nr:hypothetical protein [bacterium]